MHTHELIPHIYDAYQLAETAVSAKAPQMLPMLEKALELVLAQHVIFYPPSKLQDNWLSGVFSQEPTSNRQYIVTHDHGRFNCDCPCCARAQFTHAGRAYCKHIFAVKLYIKAIKVHKEKIPFNPPYQAQLISDFERRNEVQLVRA